jgi:hypothetical protein
MTDISRRAVVTAIPAFAIPAKSIEARAHEDAALIRTWKELEAHTEAWGQLPRPIPDRIFDQYAERYFELQSVLTSTPAHSLSGLAAKFRHLMASEFDDDLRAFIWNSVASDFDRLVGAS